VEYLPGSELGGCARESVSRDGDLAGLIVGYLAGQMVMYVG
jgi:hypothetical protein